MMFDRMRVYDAGHFHDVELPDWYHEARRLSETRRLARHMAFDRALGCEHTLLTGEGAQSGWIEVRFWPSPTHGIFVLVETPLGLVEQVVILNPTDWLPFLTQHLTQLITVAAQSAMLDQQLRLTNAFTSWARHGEGSHVDRESGLSRIDLDNDRDSLMAAQFHQAMARADKGPGA